MKDYYTVTYIGPLGSARITYGPNGETVSHTIHTSFETLLGTNRKTYSLRDGDFELDSEHFSMKPVDFSAMKQPKMTGAKDFLNLVQSLK